MLKRINTSSKCSLEHDTRHLTLPGRCRWKGDLCHQGTCMEIKDFRLLETCMDAGGEGSGPSCQTLIWFGLWNFKFMGFRGITPHSLGWESCVKLLGPTAATGPLRTSSRPGWPSSIYFGFCGVCFFLSNDFCSSSCGNLQVKPEPNPRHVPFLQSFVPRANYRGRATKFPSQGQQLPLLSRSLSKRH